MGSFSLESGGVGLMWLEVVLCGIEFCDVLV